MPCLDFNVFFVKQNHVSNLLTGMHNQSQELFSNVFFVTYDLHNKQNLTLL